MKKRMGKLVALGLSAVVAVGVLAACGGGGGNSQGGSEAASSGEPAAAAPAAAAGGTLTFGCQMYSDGIVDPAYDTNGAWNAMRYGATECLFKFDDAMNVQPWLAESCDISDDHKTWTIKLKDGVKFSNGTDMTASAVAASLQRTIDEGDNGTATPETYDLMARSFEASGNSEHAAEIYLKGFKDTGDSDLRKNAMDAYLCEALLECIRQGDWVDMTDVRRHIRNEKARDYTLQQMQAQGLK